MKVVINIEANGLKPDKIWCIVCKDIDTGEISRFNNLTTDTTERDKWNEYRSRVSHWIGHNILGYDYPVLLAHGLMGVVHPGRNCTDTLVISKMADYPRKGHSVEHYAEEFGDGRQSQVSYSQWSKELLLYCERKCDIAHKIYQKYDKYIHNSKYQQAIELEQQFQLVCNNLHDNGFSFNVKKAEALLDRVEGELAVLDKDILEAFPPRLKLIKEVNPRGTKHGTISLTSIPKVLRQDIADLSIDSPFSYCVWTEFNPSSHKQIIQILNEAGWRPVEKTTTHIQVERELQKLKHTKRSTELDLRLEELYTKINNLRVSGWKVSERNLETLPDTAPLAARLLAKRILLEARRRTLTEWLELVWHEIEIKHDQAGMLGIDADGQLIQNLGINKGIRIDAGAQTILKSQGHLTGDPISKDNTGLPKKTLLEWLKTKRVNVSSVKENANSTLITVIGQEQLEVCCAVIATVHLVGTKNTPINFKIISQRIHGKFYGLGAWSGRMAHQNPNTANIPNAVKVSDGSKTLYGKELRALWQAPKNRLLVGVDAEAIQLRVFAHLINDPNLTNAIVNGKKSEGTDPHSLNKKYFGSFCKTRNAAKHSLYAMFFGGGPGKIAEIMGCTKEEAEEAIASLIEKYPGLHDLQTKVFPYDAKRGYFIGLDGRAVRIPGDTVGNRKHLCMSGYLQNGEAVIMKAATLKWIDKLKEYDAKLVNFVHDEWQIECPNNMATAISIADMVTESLVSVGQQLDLNCSMAGSYYNDDDKDYTIATNWSKTH